MKSNTRYRFHRMKPTLEENHEMLYSRAIKWFISITFRENLTTNCWIILPCSTYRWRHSSQNIGFHLPKYTAWNLMRPQNELLLHITQVVP